MRSNIRTTDFLQTPEARTTIYPQAFREIRPSILDSVVRKTKITRATSLKQRGKECRTKAYNSLLPEWRKIGHRHRQREPSVSSHGAIPTAPTVPRDIRMINYGSRWLLPAFCSRYRSPFEHGWCDSSSHSKGRKIKQRAKGPPVPACPWVSVSGF